MDTEPLPEPQTSGDLTSPGRVVLDRVGFG